MPFRWSVDRVDWDGPLGWRDVPITELFRVIIPKLHNYETMKWSEIEGASSHFVDLTDCSAEAQARAQEINLREDPLFSLRITGPKRVWGVRDIAILRLVWWDPRHTVCPSLR